MSINRIIPAQQDFGIILCPVSVRNFYDLLIQNFKEIDTPTELERAQINQTKAQTDSVYVQSGILSPDEVRDNLIKDPNSGYNDIQGEGVNEEEEYSFFDEPEQQENNGGSASELRAQDFFTQAGADVKNP